MMDNQFTEEDYFAWLAEQGLVQDPYAGSPQWANDIDPMSRAQLEGSARDVATGNFQRDVMTAGPDVAQGLQDQFVGQVLPHMAEPVQEHMQGMGEATLVAPTIRSGQAFAEGDYDQGIRELAPHAMTAATLGVGPAMRGAGMAFNKIAPEVFEQAGNYISQMPGVTGTVARQVAGRVPQAGATVGAMEGAKQAVNTTAAVAEDTEPPKPPRFSPKNKASVLALQKFLNANGKPVNEDGTWKKGGETDEALKAHVAERNRWLAENNTPELRKLRQAERNLKVQKGLNKVEADRASRAETERKRRAGVLAEADKRYADRSKSFGQQATQFAQDNIGNVIMGSAAMFGAKGLAKVPGQRQFSRQLDDVGNALSRRRQLPDESEMRGFVNTYDKAKGTGLDYAKQGGEMAGVYGALAGEMYGSHLYLEEARKEYNAALKAFEAAGKSADGGKERELADRVAKAKAEVKKWDRLQGAGLHGMGYYTGGKMLSGAGNALARRPSAAATMQRETFAQRLRPAPAPPQSGQAQIAGPTASPVSQGSATRQGQAGHTKGAQGQSQGSQPQNQSNQTLKYASLSKPSKIKLAEAFKQNGGTLTKKQADAIAPNVNPERLDKALSEIRRLHKGGLSPDAIIKFIKRGGMIAGTGTIGTAAAYNALGPRQDQ